MKGLNAEQAGYILVSQPLMMFLFSPFAGRLSDRVEPRLVASVGMGMRAAGLALLIEINTRTGLGYIVACLVLLGLGFALFSSPNTNAVMSSVSKRFYRGGLGHPGYHAPDRADAEHGDRDHDHGAVLGTAMIAPANYPQLLKANRTASLSLRCSALLGCWPPVAAASGRGA